MVKKLANRMFGIVLMMMLMMTFSLKVSAGTVIVKSGVNGTVAVDKTTANPGETVTITVTPDGGYYAEKANVKAEKTIDGGSAQAPGLKADNPGVGSFVEIQGNEPADVSAAATYTFTMPEAPYGVQVSAEFKARTPITASMIDAIDNQEYTGSAITPTIVVKDGDNPLSLDTDYTVEYINNTEVGQATVTVTGKGKYTGTATVNFTIYRETYEVRWGQGDPWDSQHVIAMTEDADGNWVAADQEMAATSEFKIVKKYEAAQTTETWYGAQADGKYWITSDKLGKEITLGTTNEYKNLYFPTAGTYTFTFDPSTSKLVVTGVMIYNVTIADNIEHGEVIADPTSGKAGDPITITATPDTGYKLGHLVINGENVAVTQNEDGTYTYILTMPASDVTVGATFSMKLYYITKAPTENGSFDVSMTGGYMGDYVEIYPEPNDGYVVDQVIVTAQNGTQVDVTPSADRYTFNMPASDVTVSVTFRALQISYEVRWGKTVGDSWETENVIPMTKDADGKWVAANQAMEATSEFKIVKLVENQEPVWYGAQADGNYWITTEKLGVDIPLGTTSGYNNLYFPNDGTYTFTFDPATNKLVVTGVMLYNITIADGIVNGTVTTDPAGPVAAGTEVTINANPAEGYEVGTITVMNGETQVTVENNKFVMPAGDVTVNVTFVDKQYVYTTVEEVKCFVMNGNGLAAEGTEITVRLVADSGTKFKQASVMKVIGNGPERVEEAINFTTAPVDGSNDIDLTFVMPAAEVEIHAIFADTYTITVGNAENGMAYADKLEAIEGETVTITVMPDTEYMLDEIYYTYIVDGSVVRGELLAGENNTYTFTMPAADAQVVVTFKSIYNRYVLNYTASSEGGTVSVVNSNDEAINPADQVAETTRIYVTVTPAEGYEIESFSLETEEEVPVNFELENGVYTFFMPSSNTTILVSFKQIQVELVGVTFTDARNWATYYSGTKNLALPQGVKAYDVNGVVNDAVDITEIGYIPAGVGVLLYSEIAAEQVMTTLYTGETGSYTSMLVGSDEAQTITSGYVLYNNNFIRSEEGTVAAHRCYLPATQVSGAPRILKIGMNDVPTAIESIIAQGNVVGIKYVNLNGMTSNEPFRGINIAVITFTDGSTTTVKVVK